MTPARLTAALSSAMLTLMLSWTFAGNSAIHARQVTRESGATTVWDGVYTAPQAARGKGLYETHCALCHSHELTGASEPGGDAAGTALVGARFWDSWGDASLGSLFDLMSRKMPNDAPGSLDDKTYAEILAYILQRNQFPAGSSELSADAVESIQVVNQDGKPMPIADSTLVRVVGCLENGRSRGMWLLTSAGDPLKTRDPIVDPDDTRAAATKPGSRTLELSDVFPEPAAHIGHRVEVRGFFSRGDAVDRVNVTSLGMLSATCEAK